MEFLLLLSLVFSIGVLICYIIVLTKLFPSEGVGKGFLAILCGLYAFTWGWQHKDEHNLQTVMLIWSVLVVLGVILNIIIEGA
jgi:hypothetical protein